MRNMIVRLKRRRMRMEREEEEEVEEGGRKEGKKIRRADRRK